MTATDLETAIDELRINYPQMTISADENETVIAEGDYCLDAEYDGVRLVETFVIRVAIPPDYPKSVSSVKEISNIISSDYEHLYEDRSFCLGIDGELRMGILDNPSMVAFLEGPVRSYLYSALFYRRYGRYPFGDRAHGSFGIMQFYMEMFDVDNASQALDIIRFIEIGNYRGHLPCPCGSGVKLRNCHGEQLFEIINGEKRGVILKDWDKVKKHAYIEEQYRNHPASVLRALSLKSPSRRS